MFLSLLEQPSVGDAFRIMKVSQRGLRESLLEKLYLCI